jgi:integrase
MTSKCSTPDWLQSGADICTVQELLEHSDVSTTMIYARVLKVTAGETPGLLDALALNLLSARSGHRR